MKKIILASFFILSGCAHVEAWHLDCTNGKKTVIQKMSKTRMKYVNPELGFSVVDEIDKRGNVIQPGEQFVHVGENLCIIQFR